MSLHIVLQFPHKYTIFILSFVAEVILDWSSDLIIVSINCEKK